VCVLSPHLHGTEIWISGEIIPGLQTHYGLLADDFEEALAELKRRGVTFLSSTPLQMSHRCVAIVTDNDGQQLSIAASH
jgi:hypothetical protein